MLYYMLWRELPISSSAFFSSSFDSYLMSVISVPIPSEVGALVTTLSVGNDCTGLPLDGVGLNTPVGEEFGQFDDAVVVALSLLGVLKVGAANMNLELNDCVRI